MYGVVTTTPGGYQLRFTRHMAYSVEKVWAALTVPDQIITWLAEAQVDLAPGGQVQLRWLNTDEQGNGAVARGTVTAIDPPRLLEYDTDIHGRLRWELRPEGDGCQLTFTVHVPGHVPQIERLLAGWHIHLDHLADALGGQVVNWPHWTEEHYDQWSQYNNRYAVLLKERP